MKRFRIRLLISLTLLCTGWTTLHGQEMPPVTKGAWTIAVIPDTQFYSANDKDAPLFTQITEWLVANREARNIQLILHVGDIVNDNKPQQWINARNSMKVLDGKIPYVLSVGNHDIGKGASDRSTMLNEHFKISDNPLNEKMLGGLFKEGELENAWYHFKNEQVEAIVFALEFGPRKEVVDWANGVAAKHPGLPLILVTHEFIDQESSLTSDDGLPRRTTPKTTNNPHKYGIAKKDTVYCGEELWQVLVSKHPNFCLVVNGHYKSLGKDGNGRFVHIKDLTSCYRSDPNGDGHVTHQMLFNAQWAPRGGHGWLRLLEFQPDGKTVQVRTFSPYLAGLAEDPSKGWRRELAYEFTFELSPGIRKP